LLCCRGLCVCVRGGGDDAQWEHCLLCMVPRRSGIYPTLKAAKCLTSAEGTHACHSNTHQHITELAAPTKCRAGSKLSSGTRLSTNLILQKREVASPKMWHTKPSGKWTTIMDTRLLTRSERSGSADTAQCICTKLYLLCVNGSAPPPLTIICYKISPVSPWTLGHGWLLALLLPCGVLLPPRPAHDGPK